MRKIPTLFVRDFEHDNGRYVTRQVTPGAEWVMEGLGVATRKVDGTAVALLDLGQDPGWSSSGLQWWVRREVKPGKDAPYGFFEIDRDETTGKTVGWIPAATDGRWKEIQEAIAQRALWVPGTYELLGPKVNRNPEGREAHVLHPHGQHGAESVTVQRTFDGIMEFLLINHRGWEGLVFWREPGNRDAPMAKIKARDFRQ